MICKQLSEEEANMILAKWCFSSFPLLLSVPLDLISKMVLNQITFFCKCMKWEKPHIWQRYYFAWYVVGSPSYTHMPLYILQYTVKLLFGEWFFVNTSKVYLVTVCKIWKWMIISHQNSAGCFICGKHALFCNFLIWDVYYKTLSAWFHIFKVLI